MGIEITLAKTAGFCFGVKRAVDIAHRAVGEGTGHTYMLGPIIHNNTIIDELEKKGAVIIGSPSQAGRDGPIIIRAHGAGKQVYDELKALGHEYIDATCPYVKKIHSIVHEHMERGYEIIIIGDGEHPEVIGINGWCSDRARVFYDEQRLEEFLKADPQFAKKDICVVAQTTINRKKWEKCLATLNKECTNLKIFDTICNATNERQIEAAEIAAQSELMVVIGSVESSNTRKLAEVCREKCSRVLHIETAADLPKGVTEGINRIGVTAGASTPAFIIKEVVNSMIDERNMTEGEMSFAEEFEKSFKTLSSGDIVTGVVVGIAPNEIHVDLGTKADGYIPISEFSDDPSVDPANVLHIGDEIEVFVVRVNDVEGTIMLSKKKIDSIKGWKEIERSCEEGSVVEGTIVEAVKGGVIAIVNDIRVFVPASLAAERYTADLSTMVGNKARMRIIEINRQRRRVTGSIKVVLEEEKKVNSEKIWAEIEEGKHYTGVVKSITSYGVFVDIGGVDGMVHISELSWSRIRHPSDVVKVGDTLDVFVLSANPETKKISLGCKKPEDNPWEILKAKYNVGDVIDCKIVKLMSFGAFAEVIPGIDGLIHISQIATHRVAKPEDELTVGQHVQAKIMGIDFDAKRVNLTIRGLLEESPEAPVEAPAEAAAEAEAEAPAQSEPEAEAEAPADAE